MTVELNQKGGGIKTAATDTTFATPNNKVVAYASSFDNDTSGSVTTGDGLVVATGPSSSVTVDFEDEFLRASGTLLPSNRTTTGTFTPTS